MTGSGSGCPVLQNLVVCVVDGVCVCVCVCACAAEMVPFRSLADDFCDLEFFKLLVVTLQSHGIHVAIASFGLYPVIQVRARACCGLLVLLPILLPSPLSQSHGTTHLQVCNSV